MTFGTAATVVISSSVSVTCVTCVCVCVSDLVAGGGAHPLTRLGMLDDVTKSGFCSTREVGEGQRSRSKTVNNNCSHFTEHVHSIMLSSSCFPLRSSKYEEATKTMKSRRFRTNSAWLPF